MIIFFDKSTKEIVGTVMGKTHTAAQLNSWVGDPETTGRGIIEWNVNDSGEFTLEHPQADLFLDIDKDPMTIYQYLVTTDENGEFTGLTGK